MGFVSNTTDDRDVMLQTLGVASTADLFEAIPSDHRFPKLDLPPALTEMEVLARIEQLAGRNTAGRGVRSYVGAGAYNHFIPSVVPHLCGRGEFATAYTPYQAEASQGTLQAIFEYQSMLCDLLDMDVVNASHYDGATALAEAALMAVRCTRGRNKVVFGGSVHPDYLAVAQTYLDPQGIPFEIVGDNTRAGGSAQSLSELVSAVDEETAALVVSNPDFFGRLHDLSGVANEVHDRGALLVMNIDPIATALFKSPGTLGADIVTGEGQPLGIPMSFGGPYLGIFAARSGLVRKMPGRLAGQTTDADGQRGFVLTLNTREQHIRREKATSNICTNQGLMALRAAVYLASLGPAGLREVAELCYQKANYASTLLAEVPGCEVNPGNPGPFFREFVLTTPVPAEKLLKLCEPEGIVPGLPLSRYFPDRTHDLLVAVTETATADELRSLATLVGRVTAEAGGAK